MLKDNKNKHIYGAAEHFNKDRICKRLLEFLELHLPGFSHYLKSVDGLLHKEDDITQQLSFYLDAKTRDTKNDIIPFRFCNQFAYPNTPYSSDIGIIVEMFSRRDPFFVVEAKRLPTPGSNRKKEYVSGKKGGIERFKMGLHGNGLQVSAMMGYITQNNFSFWHSEINSWIGDLFASQGKVQWQSDDLLIEQQSNGGIGKYKSLNKRLDSTSIILYHYWISLS